MLKLLALERMMNKENVIDNLKNHENWFLKQEKAVKKQKLAEKKEEKKIGEKNRKKKEKASRKSQ